MRNKLNPGNYSNKGFTLVEVIVSIGFLCIACGIIIQLFISSGELRAKSALKEMASLKASNAIEACMISDSPENVGKEIFNQAFTDYKKTNNGYIIREYFSDEWKDPVLGEVPVFVVKVEIIIANSHPDTAGAFNTKNNQTLPVFSGLYDINVTAGYVSTDREDSILAEYNTAKHYVYTVDYD